MITYIFITFHPVMHANKHVNST